MRVARSVCALSVGVPVGVCGRGFQTRRQHPSGPFHLGLGLGSPSAGGSRIWKDGRRTSPLRGCRVRWADGKMAAASVSTTSGSQFSVRSGCPAPGPWVGRGASASLILQSALGPASPRLQGDGEERPKPRAAPPPPPAPLRGCTPPHGNRPGPSLSPTPPYL